ncbi:MAG: hypothetical protein LBF72_01720 [Holosporales bacterium]|jgi:hypothetical protein|nr:hypothetical protein [Holosporales bacterium]
MGAINRVPLLCAGLVAFLSLQVGFGQDFDKAVSEAESSVRSLQKALQEQISLVNGLSNQVHDVVNAAKQGVGQRKTMNEPKRKWWQRLFRRLKLT